MFAVLKELIPGAQHWPRFLRNRSEQFEARLSLVQIEPSPSVLLAGMDGLAAAGGGRARRGARRSSTARTISSSA